jgi:hypothetical protein
MPLIIPNSIVVYQQKVTVPPQADTLLGIVRAVAHSGIRENSDVALRLSVTSAERQRFVRLSRRATRDAIPVIAAARSLT